jgi:hypothetical protein
MGTGLQLLDHQTLGTIDRHHTPDPNRSSWLRSWVNPATSWVTRS